VISGFRGDVDEICSPLWYYATYSGSCVGHLGKIYRSHLQESGSPRTDRLSRNVRMESPLYAT